MPAPIVPPPITATVPGALMGCSLCDRGPSRGCHTALMADAEPSRPRRGRSGYDLESLLQVAAELFTVQGYDATSMEDLSRRLGITKSAIYHHVENKEALLRLAVNRALDGLFDVADEVRGQTDPAIDRLERLVRGSVGVLIERQPFVTMLLRVHGNTEAEREALARRRQFDRYVAELVREAAAEGDVRADLDPAVAARLLFGLVNSLVEWYRPRRGLNAQELADAVCAVTFEGLRVRRGVEG